MQTNRADASTLTIPEIPELSDVGSCRACFSESQAMRNGILLDLDVTTRKVGSLFIFAGCCAALSQKKPSKNIIAMLDDWVLVYERTARLASKEQGESAGSNIWIQSTSIPIGRKRAIGELMLIQFPRSCFKGLESHIEAICKGEADFVASPLLTSYLESLWNYVPQLQENEAQVVEEITSQLVRSCVARTGKMRGSAVRPASMNRLEAAKQYISDRISAPGLTVENVQNWVGISRRQLYSLFKPYGGVSHYIQSQRLRKCHYAISDPLEARSVARIAEQYGIDPNRIERLFLEEFGYGPDELRWNATRQQLRRHSSQDEDGRCVRIA